MAGLTALALLAAAAVHEAIVPKAALPGGAEVTIAADSRPASAMVTPSPSPVRATSPAQPAPAPRERLQSARDLWALAREALSSGRTEDLERAAMALHLCAPHVADADVRRLASSGTDPTKVRGSERQLASEEITRRCLGFERMGAGERKGLAESIRTRLQQAGSRFADGFHEESSSLQRDTVIALLQAPDAEAFERARPALAAGLARRLGMSEESDDRLALDTALLLASCHYGRDCSASSFDALRRCTYQGICGQGLFDHWRQMVPATHHERVEKLQHEIQQAIATRNWIDLGL